MNGWRRVPRADLIPQSCAVLPQLGAAHRDGYIDVGTELVGWDPHCYISVHAARLLGEFVGLEDPEPLRDRIAALEAQVERLEAELEDERRVNSAIEVLESKEFRARKKPGRPKAAA